MRTSRLMLTGMFTLALGCGAPQTNEEIGPIPPPPPVVAPPETRGAALTNAQIEEIEQTIQLGREQVIRCYEDELERRGNKDLEGRVAVKILIGTATRAQQVTIAQSTLNVEAVHECIKQAVMSWEFPTLKEEAWYSTTFALSPAY